MPFNLECLVIIIQMEYYIQESLKNRSSTYEQFLGPFYRKTSAWQGFLTIIQLLPIMVQIWQTKETQTGVWQISIILGYEAI